MQIFVLTLLVASASAHMNIFHPSMYGWLEVAFTPSLVYDMPRWINVIFAARRASPAFVDSLVLFYSP